MAVSKGGKTKAFVPVMGKHKMGENEMKGKMGGGKMGSYVMGGKKGGSKKGY